MYFGKTMFVGMSLLLLSGCSINLPLKTSASSGSVWKSFDSGQTFVSKIMVDETRKISSADIVSFVVDEKNPDMIYMGTLGNGLFKTMNGGERWEQVIFPPLKNYGVALGREMSEQIYASGVYDGVAKLYRSDDAGKNWKETYTEPGKDVVITAVSVSPDITDVVYVGSSSGALMKSINGGATWDNIGVAYGPVTKILFEKGNAQKIILFVPNQGVSISMDGGNTWNRGVEKLQGTPENVRSTTQSTRTLGSKYGGTPDGMTTVALDPSVSGTMYAGAKKGIFRSRDNGLSWEALDIIESSKKFPVRAIAIHPTQSNEIVYIAGQAFYRSVDGGLRWSTTKLDIDRGVSFLTYIPSHPNTLYFTLRKY
ncbi:MAG: VPS10 domain-containing protein [Minisyncoccota bacterium]